MIGLLAAAALVAAPLSACDRAAAASTSAARIVEACSPDELERWVAVHGGARARVARTLAAGLARASTPTARVLLPLVPELDDADRAALVSPVGRALEEALRRGDSSRVPLLLALAGAIGPAAHALLSDLAFVEETQTGPARSAALLAISSVGSDDLGSLDALVRASADPSLGADAAAGLANVVCRSERYGAEAARRLAPMLEGAGRFPAAKIDARTAGLAMFAIGVNDSCIGAPELVGTLAHVADSNAPLDLRRKAIVTLTSTPFVNIALPALPALVNVMRESTTSPLYAAAAQSGERIAGAAANLADDQAPQNIGATIGDLLTMGAMLDSAMNRHAVPPELSDITRVRNSFKLSIEHLEGIRARRRAALLHSLGSLFQYGKVGNWAIASVAVLTVVAYAAVIALVWSIVLLVHPRRLVGLAPSARSGNSDAAIKIFGISLNPRALLFVGPFARSRRAMDAWIARYRTRVRKRLPAPAVEPGEIVLSRPGSNERSGLEDVVRAIEHGRRTTILIRGAAGSGKTAVLDALARAALDMHPPMLPVRFDHRLDAQTRDDVIARVRGAVATLTDTDPLPDEIIAAMLSSKRILIIVDDVSRLPPATRRLLEPETSNLDCAAVVMASREDDGALNGRADTFDVLPKTIVPPPADAAEPVRRFGALLAGYPLPALIVDRFNALRAAGTGDPVQEYIAYLCRSAGSAQVTTMSPIRDLALLATAIGERGEELGIALADASNLLGPDAGARLALLVDAGLIEVRPLFGAEVRFVHEPVRAYLAALSAPGPVVTPGGT